ncbi:hypothetical protein ROA7450_03089 [Roseovarius albus]|uniref:Peroxidase n=1 Tax=Roseovarius albus TaxID=1247867 RepID=A0A1X6ZRX5_9RHOB|nr:hypothetical protein [Roseovarius albus]SLN59655.1 hypothetical protein ROA7450_03089 [Roseovarius albus]
MVATWKLQNDIADDTQGIVASGFGRLEYGVALFLELSHTNGAEWLRAISEDFPATTASQTSGPVVPQAISLAFTWTGLEKMGLPDAALASFSAPFREGMMQQDRLRRLGDKRKGKWLDTVIDGGPIWSGNIDAPQQKTPMGAYDVSSQATEDTFVNPTEKTVHAMLLLYAQTEEEVLVRRSNLESNLNANQVSVVHTLPLVLDTVADEGFSREHFGFADGISQPIPYDEGGAVSLNGEESFTGDPVHGVRLGEVLMGHKNGHQEVAPGPVVEERKEDGENPLRPHHEARGFRDLGLNGSYLVVRQLHQNVAGFWKGMEAAAEVLKKQDPMAEHITPMWVAEKVVGRGVDGRMLRPDGRIPNGPNSEINNDFFFFDDDRHGFGCPLGSHVRRANPRDSLAPKPEMKQTLLDAANNHRILRRARKYGSTLMNTSVDDGKERGLLFMCLNTDIARQFEFTQQTWLLNSDFSVLFEETDPLVGPDGQMTIPEDPLRRRVPVQTFVQMVGGEYFFLPSISGLKYLASL